MSVTIDAAKLLRPGLLDGSSVLVAGAPALSPAGVGGRLDDGDSLAGAVASACTELGAVVSVWRRDDSLPAQIDMLVVDAAGAFASGATNAGDAPLGAEASRDALRMCLDGAWEVTRAVAAGAFIDAGRPGRIVYLAPAAADGQLVEYAEAARAGLENLARTLSIEWARYGVTPVTIAPGAHTSASEVAALTAYLGSAAGAYFSGCLFDLRGLVGEPTAPGR